MAIDEQFITELIKDQDPLAAVWRQMERVYTQTSEVCGDLRGLMDDRESALNDLERGVYRGFFEAYELLLERAGAQDENYVLSLFDECPFVIITDSLSVREAVLLEKFWEGEAWSVERKGFAVAPFPPMTESLSNLLLGVPGPASGRDRPQFTYRYVAGPEHIPAMPPSGSLLVWMRLPDTALEEVTVAQTHTVADAFHSTVRTLEAVLETSGRDAALATSDHGYLYARSPTQYWPMPGGVEEIARSAFPRASRVRPLTDERARGLRDHESPRVEQRFFAFGEAHAAMRGRHWWGSASPNDRCTAHGGLSFVECLVPVLKIWRR
ncbi:MAG: hypothetical protein E3J21_19765 [Anaerolineales bacterium]|nr:MAG: hypothetical protein E3J21_19765 [Anaerolineales bacterium]